MGRLYGPLTQLSNVRVDVLTALVSFERVFEVLDLEPMIPDASRRTHRSAGRPATRRVRPRRLPLPGCRQVSLASLETVAMPETRVSNEVLEGRDLSVGAGQMVALVGPSGAGKTTLTHLVARLYDVPGWCGADRRRRRTRRASASCTTDRLRHAGRAHVPRHDPRQPALRPAGDTRRGPDDALGRAQIGDLVSAFPTASTPSSAIAATDSAAESGSGSPSLDCC